MAGANGPGNRSGWTAWGGVDGVGGVDGGGGRTVRVDGMAGVNRSGWTAWAGRTGRVGLREPVTSGTMVR